MVERLLTDRLPGQSNTARAQEHAVPGHFAVYSPVQANLWIAPFLESRTSAAQAVSASPIE